MRLSENGRAERTRPFTVPVGDFHTLTFQTDRTSRQKVAQETKDSNNTRTHPDLYPALGPTTARDICFSSEQGPFSRKDQPVRPQIKPQ